MQINFTIPILETERLKLRALTENDWQQEVEFYASDRAEFVGGKMKPGQVWRMLALNMGHWAFRGYGYWAIEEKASGDYLGRVSIWYPTDWPEPEIGWCMQEKAEGKGIAYEAAVRVRQYAYETLNMDPLISLIAAGNQRSIALAERLGATLESETEHETFGNVLIYRHLSAQALRDLSSA